jgi:acyl-CoA thioester hydrolase
MSAWRAACHPRFHEQGDPMTEHYPVRVHYEDTDMAGIVYHANYLKFIERARSDWVRRRGLDQNAMREAGIVFVVRRVEADYLRPARFDDVLDVATEITAVTGARLTMRQTASRDGEALFRAIVTLVCATSDGRPTRLPRALIEGVGAGP